MNVAALAARLIPTELLSGVEEDFGGEVIEAQRIGAAGPLSVVVTSRVGNRTHPVTGEASKFHNGTDYAVPVGTGVIAVESGKVIAVYIDEDINGTAVVIDHRPAGLPFLSAYVHLSAIVTPKGFVYGKTPKADASAAVAALKGKTVRRGELIGLSGGAKGDWGAGRSTGPHLHLTLKRYTPTGATETVESLDFIEWGGVSVSERDTSGALRRIPQ